MSKAMTCSLGGDIYDAVAVPAAAPGRLLECGDCDGLSGRVCNRLPPCTPANGRTDGLIVKWKLRPSGDGIQSGNQEIRKGAA